MARTAEVVYVGRPEDLLAAQAKIRASSEATSGVVGKSYGEIMAAGDAAGKAAAEHARLLGASLDEQNAAYDSAAKAAGVAGDKIAASAKLAGDAAAHQAAAIGGSLGEQTIAYARAATAAQRAGAASAKAAEESAAAQEAAAAKAAKAAEESSAKIDAAAKRIAVGGLLAIGAAAYGVHHAAETTAELAKETLLLHNATGLSIQSASTYASVASAQELNVKQLNQSFGTLSKNVQAVENAHAGLTKAAKTQENAFRLLGLPLSSIIRAHGDLNKLLPEITGRFEKMPGGIEKTAVGMALFGRGWQALVPLMHQGALGLKDQLAEAEKMGATLGGSSVKSLKDFQKAQEDAKYGTLGMELAIGEYLAPALTKLMGFLANTTHSLGEGVHWLEKHETAAISLAGVLTLTLGGALTVLAYTKAKAFIGATKDMMGAGPALAARMGLTASVVTGAGEEIVGSADATAVGVDTALGATGVGLVVVGLGAAAVELGKHWSTVMRGLEETGQAMANVVIKALNRVVSVVEKVTLGLVHLGKIKELSGAGGEANLAEGGYGNLGKKTRENETLAPGSVTRTSGLPQGNKGAFASALAKETGLPVNFLTAWMNHEQGSSTVEGGNNWLNIETGLPGGGSGPHGASAQYAERQTPGGAARLEAEWLKKNLPQLLRAHSAAEAVEILEHSGYAESHYGNVSPGTFLSAATTTGGSSTGGNPGYYEPAGPKAAKINEYGGPHGEILHETAAQHTHRVLMERKAKIEHEESPAEKHLTLTHGEQAGVNTQLHVAAAARETLNLDAGYASRAGELWQHTRTLQEAKRKPLDTAQGAHEQREIDGQDILTAKSRKLYYAREVKALQKEATAWGKLRDSYLKFARHAHGHAKIAAMRKATTYDGKVKAAKQEAEALDGTIADTEAQIEEAENVLSTALPAEIAAAQAEQQGGDLSTYQAANSKIDLEARAEVLVPGGGMAANEARAKQLKEANANTALSGGYGQLSEEGVLQVKGDLLEFQKALQSATAATEEHTNAVQADTKALLEREQQARGLAEVENGTLMKAISDMVSGQIGGVAYQGRTITAGVGTAARY